METLVNLELEGVAFCKTLGHIHGKRCGFVPNRAFVTSTGHGRLSREGGFEELEKTRSGVQASGTKLWKALETLKRQDGVSTTPKGRRRPCAVRKSE